MDTSKSINTSFGKNKKSNNTIFQDHTNIQYYIQTHTNTIFLALTKSAAWPMRQASFYNNLDCMIWVRLAFLTSFVALCCTSRQLSLLCCLEQTVTLTDLPKPTIQSVRKVTVHFTNKLLMLIHSGFPDQQPNGYFFVQFIASPLPSRESYTYI